MDRNQRKQPIVEALCEIAFEESEWDATIPGLFYQRLRDRFPVKSGRPGADVTSRLMVREAATAEAPRESWTQFARQDGAAVVQLRRDLVVVNQLRRDTQFAELSSTVRDVVHLYQELAKPRGVARLGVRTISVFVVPGSDGRVEDYFLVYPRIPKSLSSQHGPSLLRLEMPSQHDGHSVVAVFGFAPGREARNSAFVLQLLDIAVLLGLDDSFGLLDETLRQANENLGRAFENSITDKARRQFGSEAAPTSASAAAADAGSGARSDIALAGILRLLALSSPEGDETSIVLSQARRISPSLMELQGLGKEIWRGEDAQDYVDRLRDEWT